MATNPKRTIRIVGPGVDLPITVATKVKLTDAGKQFIHIDQLKDGNWRLVFTSGVVDDWSKVESLLMIRED